MSTSKSSQKKPRRKKRKKSSPTASQFEKQLTFNYQEWLVASSNLQVTFEKMEKLNKESSKKVGRLAKEIRKGNQEVQKINHDLAKLLAETEPNYDQKLIEKLPKTAKIPEKKNLVGAVVFYVFLGVIVLLLGALLKGQSSSGTPNNIGGYAPMTILTGSMERVYPKDSLIVAKVTDPKSLSIGDDVTYLKENNSTVTHRIVEINENYMGTGQRGFGTKGVENPRKDEEMVRAENIIGKVVFSSPILGKILLFIRANLFLTAITVIITIISSDVLFKYIKIMFKKEESK